MLVEADLPDDPAQLQAMLVEARSEITKRDREIVVRDQQITTLRSVGAEACGKRAVRTAVSQASVSTLQLA